MKYQVLARLGALSLLVAVMVGCGSQDKSATATPELTKVVFSVPGMT